MFFHVRFKGLGGRGSILDAMHFMDHQKVDSFEDAAWSWIPSIFQFTKKKPFFSATTCGCLGLAYMTECCKNMLKATGGRAFFGLKRNHGYGSK